ncbi:MAG: S8 family serine peptidase [bacterium]|nr:S8 family serine peptidase [bacterium]
MIENLFVVYGSKEWLESLRQRGDIKYVTENFQAELIEPIIDERGDRSPRNPLDAETTTPGQNAIQTTRVNRELGITGQGVLVANLDTGVDGNHPALASRWRGNFAPAAHCWRDALGNAPTFPSDLNSHGTHVMGTIAGRAFVGLDTITIGGAPNALWIANNAINQGVSGAFDNDVIDAFQWFANPDGNIATIDDVPDVIQNSWGVFTGLGYVQCFDFWNSVVLNCEAAGPVITWSAGNESTSGLRSPAIYSINAYQIFSVGAVDATNFAPPYPLATFSSRGPTPCAPALPDNFKPEISAPGVNVYSSIPGGGYSSAFSGTSMAGPHVAGVVALMREACPNCDHITIKDAVMNTATDLGVVGEDNLFGHGLINAYDAVIAVGNVALIGGVVTNANTSSPISGVTVRALGTTQSAATNFNGEYMLLTSAGTFSMEFSLSVSRLIPYSTSSLFKVTH